MSDDLSLEDEVKMLREDMRGLVQQNQRALSQINDLEDRVDELEQERERLIFRIGKLEETLPGDDAEYDELDREERVAMVKSYIMERAYASNGRFAIDYDDVRWSVFDGEPSADYCYTLMELAARDDGFSYKTDARPKQLRVNLDATNAETDFSHANNSEEGVTR